MSYFNYLFVFSILIMGLQSTPINVKKSPKEFIPVGNFSKTTIITYFADMEEFGGPIFELNWLESIEYCQERGLTLAQIDSQVENDFLANVLQNTHDGSHFWIAATDLQSEGRWRWLDGSEIKYSNWQSDDPWPGSQHCATLHEDGEWRSQLCTDQYRPLCMTKY